MANGSEARGARGVGAGLVTGALFFVLVTLFDLAIHPASLAVRAAQDSVFLCYGLHVAASIYDGRFGRLRTVTWLAMTGGFWCVIVDAFYRYVDWTRPFVDAAHWLGDVTGARPLFATSASVTAIALALISLDIAIALAPRLVRWRRVWSLAFVVAVPATALALDALVWQTAPLPDGGEAMAIPDPPVRLPEHPFFALFFLTERQSVALALIFIVAALPMLAPAMRGWRFHAGPTRSIWTLLCALLVVSWITLTAIGALYLQVYGRAWVWITIGAAAYQFAFFLVVPFALARRLPRRDAATQVFA